MIPNPPPGPLLPSVALLDPHPPVRIALPPDTGVQGLYGDQTNGQRISMHLAPPIKAGLVAFSQAMIRDGLLDPRLRQMIIVRVGYLSGSAYEVCQHRSLAESVGVAPATLDALACIDPPGLDERQATLIRFVDELVRDVRASDETVTAMQALFPVGEVLEAVMVTGNWMLLARMLATAGVQLDERRIGASFDSAARV